MADIEVLRQLEKQFELCKPLFIALGDEMRLTIISALTQAAIGGSAYDKPFPPGYFTSSKNFKNSRNCQFQTGWNFQHLFSYSGKFQPDF